MLLIRVKLYFDCGEGDCRSTNGSLETFLIKIRPRFRAQDHLYRPETPIPKGFTTAAGLNLPVRDGHCDQRVREAQRHTASISYLVSYVEHVTRSARRRTWLVLHKQRDALRERAGSRPAITAILFILKTVLIESFALSHTQIPHAFFTENFKCDLID